MEPRYPFVAIDASPEDADEIAATLFELGAMGVEERDDQTLVRGENPGTVTLVGSFENHEAAQEAIAALAEALPDRNARLEEVVGDAWRDAWKEHFEPFLFTPDILLVPPWHARPEPAPGQKILELEPGRAFGTGLHASTAMVAQILHDMAAELPGRELLDVGTGSGILAFVALLYGASRVLAIDIDDDVIEVVLENAARNGLQDRIEAKACGVDTISRTYPIVLANIEARVLRPLAPELARVVAPGGTLVLSGILESEHDEMVALYTALPRRLEHLTTLRRGDAGGERWVAIAFRAV